jgi:5-(carboxyamino)imidazole ribonucleotide synthase
MDILSKKIGIVGGGQLGKMMVLEAKRLGFYVAVLDPAADCPVCSICDELIVADFNSDDGYFKLAESVDVITYEFEHINSNALEMLEKRGHSVYPSVKSLRVIQNKYLQKMNLSDSDIPVPRLMKAYNPDFCGSAGKSMFKSCFGGYDGKGNWIIEQESDIPSGVDGFFEELVDFETEVSVIACRGIDGRQVVYPVGENIHVNSILDATIVPARIGKSSEATIAERIKKTAFDVMEVFDGVGTFCVEMFVCKDGSVLVNEVAPRPHNSGHYTIEACFANQFENHIRAITGLPLGCPDLISPAVMVNLLGQSDGKALVTGVQKAYEIDNRVHIHIYGKSQCKVGRKMGHFTVIGDNALARAEKLRGIIRIDGE